MSRRARRWIVAALVGLVAAGALASGVVAGRMLWADDGSRLDSALADAPPAKIADIAGANGLPARGVFAQITSTGHLCLSDAPLGAPRSGGGGCNPADDPLAGREFSASVAYEGGPSIESVKDARLIGLASSAVASLGIRMSDGSTRDVRLKATKLGSSDFQVFAYRFKNSDLKKGIGPTAVFALDGGGAEIDRQATGIGN
jgi:hypothetical protein